MEGADKKRHMSLFENSITGNVLNDGSTTEISGVTGGQLATVLTAYTPLSETASNTASISANDDRCSQQYGGDCCIAVAS